MLHCLVLSVDQTKAKTLPAPPPLRSKGEKVVTSCVLLRFGGHSRVNGRKQFCLMLSTTTRALKRGFLCWKDANVRSVARVTPVLAEQQQLEEQPR